MAMIMKLLEGIGCIIAGVAIFIFQVKFPQKNSGGIAMGVRLFALSISLFMIGVYILADYFG